MTESLRRARLANDLLESYGRLVRQPDPEEEAWPDESTSAASCLARARALFRALAALAAILDRFASDATRGTGSRGRR